MRYSCAIVVSDDSLMITASEVLSFSNFDYLLQVSSNSFHDDGEDVIVILERKNGQKAMVIPFFLKFVVVLFLRRSTVLRTMKI